MAQRRLLPLLNDFEGYLATVPRCDRLQDRADRLDGMALLAYHPPEIFLCNPQCKNRHCLARRFADLDRFGLGDQRIIFSSEYSRQTLTEALNSNLGFANRLVTVEFRQDFKDGNCWLSEGRQDEVSGYGKYCQNSEAHDFLSSA